MNDQFRVPPEDCLVIRAISRTKSLREAASFLKCDPAALVRKVQRISTEHGVLHKVKGRWVPTETGLRLVHWVEESVLSQKTTLEESPRLRLATTAWMAEQFVIPQMNNLSRTCPGIAWSVQVPSHGLEESLLRGLSDYVIACHAPYDPAIAHKKVYPENWVAIAPSSWKRALEGKSLAKVIDHLKERPFVRHEEINPETVVPFGSKITLASFILDNLVGVRAAVESGLGWSCVPELLVRNALRTKAIVKLDIPVHATGDVCLWWVRARKDVARNVRSLQTWMTHLR